MVLFMCAFAGAVHRGEIPGPYSDQRARTFARLALVDADAYAYAIHQADDDEQLAELLELPVAEIADVRADQDATAS